jgi:hypothetical protein
MGRGEGAAHLQVQQLGEAAPPQDSLEQLQRILSQLPARTAPVAGAGGQHMHRMDPQAAMMQLWRAHAGAAV